MTGALAGRRIVNTRAVHQAAAFNTLLWARGAVPLDYPCIAIMPPQDTAPLDKALFDLVAGRFDWLMLTSANTVFALRQHLNALALTLEDVSFSSAAVGPTTAEAAQEQLGLSSMVSPAEYTAEALARSVPIQPGARILLPESAIARPTLADMLAAREADVTVVTAYQTICGQGGVDVPALLKHRQVDALTFTSSSTVTNFLARLTLEHGQLQDALSLPAACIGTKTAATARECGFTVMDVPSEHTLGGLVDTLTAYFEQIETGEQS